MILEVWDVIPEGSRFTQVSRAVRVIWIGDPVSRDAVADKIHARDVSGSNLVYVVAEGALEIGHELIYQARLMTSAPRLGGRPPPAKGPGRSDGRRPVASCLDIPRGGRPNASTDARD